MEGDCLSDDDVVVMEDTLISSRNERIDIRKRSVKNSSLNKMVLDILCCKEMKDMADGSSGCPLTATRVP